MRCSSMTATSPPAQKADPVPVSRTDRIVGSTAVSWSTCRSSCMEARSMALSRSGRLRMIEKTLPLRSVRIDCTGPPGDGTDPPYKGDSPPRPFSTIRAEPRGSTSGRVGSPCGHRVAPVESVGEQSVEHLETVHVPSECRGEISHVIRPVEPEESDHSSCTTDTSRQVSAAVLFLSRKGCLELCAGSVVAPLERGEGETAGL